ncbi:hypothetical protein NTGBS_300003 [Candidatus Nitrotoga sp. BS]|nr:hypothetical protein NTGBS_300003 [Candidatus Nitrotoga sp. BS]
MNFSLSICDTSRFMQLGVTNERGQNAVCASHGVRAVEELRTHHRTAQ